MGSEEQNECADVEWKDAFNSGNPDQLISGINFESWMSASDYDCRESVDDSVLISGGSTHGSISNFARNEVWTDKKKGLPLSETAPLSRDIRAKNTKSEVDVENIFYSLDNNLGSGNNCSHHSLGDATRPETNCLFFSLGAVNTREVIPREEDKNRNFKESGDNSTLNPEFFCLLDTDLDVDVQTFQTLDCINAFKFPLLSPNQPPQCSPPPEKSLKEIFEPFHNARILPDISQLLQSGDGIIQKNAVKAIDEFIDHNPSRELKKKPVARQAQTCFDPTSSINFTLSPNPVDEAQHTSPYSEKRSDMRTNTLPQLIDKTFFSNENTHTDHK